MSPPTTRTGVRRLADRLVNPLVTLVRAVAAIAKTGSTPTLSELAAHTLFLRLSRLAATLIRIALNGLRAPRESNPPTPARTASAAGAQPAGSGPLLRLPRHPGWLLEALPDLAPAIADDLRAILADPALADLLAATPSLQRALTPLLRSLDLPIPSPPLPDAPPPQTPAPPQSSNPARNPTRRHERPPPNRRPHRRGFCTSTLFRLRN